MTLTKSLVPTGHCQDSALALLDNPEDAFAVKKLGALLGDAIQRAIKPNQDESLAAYDQVRAKNKPSLYRDAAARGTTNSTHSGSIGKANQHQPHPRSESTTAPVPGKGQADVRGGLPGPCDTRILIRIPEHAPARSIDLFYVREKITKVCQIKTEDIIAVSWIPTGIAVTPRNERTGATLLGRHPELSKLLNATCVEKSEFWVTYEVKRVPARING
ncbi:hypothetical protein G3M48_000498 [Beauveria asiatica]|uniref:Uncharacterized protein n=1 Tax=Beauveria asiatica TaxID=1069075 RepID=A0AAW0S8W4_9HYPO